MTETGYTVTPLTGTDRFSVWVDTVDCIRVMAPFTTCDAAEDWIRRHRAGEVIVGEYVPAVDRMWANANAVYLARGATPEEAAREADAYVAVATTPR